MVPTATEGRLDGKIIYSVGTGQGQASRFESAVHFQILQTSKTSISSQNPEEVEKRIKKKKKKKNFSYQAIPLKAQGGIKVIKV